MNISTTIHKNVHNAGAAAGKLVGRAEIAMAPEIESPPQSEKHNFLCPTNLFMAAIDLDQFDCPF